MRKTWRFLVLVGVLATSFSFSNRGVPEAGASSYVPTFVSRTGANANVNHYGVAYGAGVWVRTAGSVPSWSDDGGENWTNGTSNVSSGSYLNVEFVNGRFFALCDVSCGAGRQIQYSDDGKSWTAASAPTTGIPITDAKWSDVVYGDGLLIAVSSGMVSGNETANRILKSNDNGLTWTTGQLPCRNCSAPLTYETAEAIVYAEGLFVAVGSKIMTSSDGTTWTVRASGSQLVWKDVDYGNGVFLAVTPVGNGINHLWKSDSGATWTAVSHPSIGTSPTYVNRVRFGNGVFLFGSSQRFLTTANGSSLSNAQNWLAVGSGQWRGLGFGEGRFVAVGDTSNGGASRTISSTDTPDRTAPTIIQYSPTDGATSVNESSNVVLTFSESITAGLGGRKIVVKRTADNSTIIEIASDSSDVSYIGSTATINPNSPLPSGTAVYVLIEDGAFTDLAGNSVAGISSTTGYRFTTAVDNNAPSVPNEPNLSASSDSGASPTDDITNVQNLTFSVVPSESGGIVTLTAQSVGQANKTCTMAGSTSGASCTLAAVAEGEWSVTAVHEDASGNISPVSSALSVTVDRTAPVLASTSPANSATSVPTNSQIALTYNENISKGSGNFSLIGGSTCSSSVETISVAAAGVVVSGRVITISATSTFAFSTRHCMTFLAGVVKDVAGNNAAAMTTSSSGRIDFTVEAPDMVPPTATWVEPTSPSTSRTLSYTVTFSESVTGIAAGDFSNTGTATGCTFSPASSVANVSVVVTVTCSSDGTVVARLSANSVLDAATNTGPVSSVTATSVTIATPQVVPTSTTVPNSTPISVTPTQSNIVPVNSIPTGVSSTTLPQQVASQNSATSTSMPTSTSATTTSTTLPTIKIPNVTDDGGAVDINGQRFEADISRDNNQLLVTAGVIRAKISAVKREGGRVPLDSNGRIRVERGDSIQVDVVGFASSSQVEVRMYSEPILLGRTSVNSVGSLLASYEIPESVDDGRHTVVLIGTSAKSDNVVFALTVYVGAESDGVSLIALLVAVPIGLAVIFGLIVPAVIRRRRDEDEG